MLGTLIACWWVAFISWMDVQGDVGPTVIAAISLGLVAVFVFFLVTLMLAAFATMFVKAYIVELALTGSIVVAIAWKS